tara:strand:- start:185 stop:427 length:243 start_codon:yes stop_codon:yes gene_type:complete
MDNNKKSTEDNNTDKKLHISDVMSSEVKLMALLAETFYNGWLESDETFNGEISGYYQPEQCKEELKEKFKIWVNDKFHCS